MADTLGRPLNRTDMRIQGSASPSHTIASTFGAGRPLSMRESRKSGAPASDVSYDWSKSDTWYPRLMRPLAFVSGRSGLSDASRQRLFRSRLSADCASVLHIAETALARPCPSVGIAQFCSSEVLVIRQARVDAHLTVSELRHGAPRQDEVRRRAAICAEPDFRGRVFFVPPAIFLRRTLNADFRGMEIGPAGARFAAKSAIALVDKVRPLGDFDADLAAKAREPQHSRIISGELLRR